MLTHVQETWSTQLAYQTGEVSALTHPGALTPTSGGLERPWETLGPTWIEIDLDALAGNLTEIRAFVCRSRPEHALGFAERHGLRPPSGPPKVMVVVKADAYGHGAVETARAAALAGADALGVSTLLEGLELRRAGLTLPILMLNPLTPAEADTAVLAEVTPTVTDLGAAEALSQAYRALPSGSATRRPSAIPVHIAIDTGMSRTGVKPERVADLAVRVAAQPGLTVEGLYTHFSTGADRSPAGLALMRQQLTRFAWAAASVESRGLVVPLRHAACSAAVVLLPESYLDLVRVGNLFYGYGGSGDAVARDLGRSVTGARSATAVTAGAAALSAGPDADAFPKLREAWTMRTRVLEVREVPPGTGVGYGPDVVVKHPTRLATLPVGYADGVGAEIRSTTFRPRARLRVFVRGLLIALHRRGLLVGPLARLRPRAEGRSIFEHDGHPLDIVGRVSMQQTIVEVTARPEITPGSLVLVRIRRVLANPRLGRVYFQGGRAVAASGVSLRNLAAAGWEVVSPPTQAAG
jgi:alanine racemase